MVVVGAGYVGLPLAVEIGEGRASRRSATTRRARRSTCSNAGKSYIGDIADEHARAAGARRSKLGASTDPDVLREADVVIICVPTPLNKTKDPDNSFIMDAADDDRAAHARATC